MSNYDKIVSWGLSASAFLFFALSLALPTGYSYGSVGLVLFSLLGLRLALTKAWPAGTKTLIFLFLAMGLLWGMTFDSWGAWTGSDYPVKYWLAALVLVIVAGWGIRAEAVEWGLSMGAVGALGIAAYQYLVLSWAKATGHTNAIQFGDIAMYLGLAVWVLALFTDQRTWARMALWAAGACGVLASLLSETRGAWVVAPLLLLVVLVVLLQQGRIRLVFGAVVTMAVLVAAMVIPFGEKFSTRAELAAVELQQYLKHPQQSAETSIGQRLEQWRVAMHMIEAKPLTGWGTQGVRVEKQALVDQGFAHPSIMGYGHAHNEIIDMLVKRGVLGGTALMLFYLIPLFLFWPTRERLAQVLEPQRAQVLGLRMAASLLPIACFGFGWTQVFFAHNSGNMFYLFALVVFWGALQRLEGKAPHPDKVLSEAA